MMLMMVVMGDDADDADDGLVSFACLGQWVCMCACMCVCVCVYVHVCVSICVCVWCVHVRAGSKDWPTENHQQETHKEPEGNP